PPPRSSLFPYTTLFRSATVSIVVMPQATGQLNNSATVSATESDPDTSNNSSAITTPVISQSNGPSMTDPNLTVQTVVTGLSQPTDRKSTRLNSSHQIIS